MKKLAILVSIAVLPTIFASVSMAAHTCTFSTFRGTGTDPKTAADNLYADCMSKPHPGWLNSSAAKTAFCYNVWAMGSCVSSD